MCQETPNAAVAIAPGRFFPANHFYTAALTSRRHPLVEGLLTASPEDIVTGYRRRFPEADPAALQDILAYRPQYFFWAGGDLIPAVNQNGSRRMMLIETNSCPSGQKSLPPGEDPAGGYKALMARSFLPFARESAAADGSLAVIFDKNPMENTAYAAVLADLSGETVYLARDDDGAEDPPVRATGPAIEVRDHEGRWRPVRSAFRYVTERPWNRLPLSCGTFVYNPVAACLAGGRNKIMAHAAYERFNRDMAKAGLCIAFPETTGELSLADVPAWVAGRGHRAVIKNPYTHAGQGVWTIANPRELERFLSATHRYGRFVAQEMIGGKGWGGRISHAGTLPDASGDTYAFDLRMMIAATPSGFRPVSACARRAPRPLPARLREDDDSWDILGTNLSSRAPSGEWTTDESRLIVLDERGFERLGLGGDELIEAFVRTVCAAVAIDKMAKRLMGEGGSLDRNLFRSLDDDAALLAEMPS